MTTWKIISVVLGLLSGAIALRMVLRTLRANREPSLLKVVGVLVTASTLNLFIGQVCMYYNLP